MASPGWYPDPAGNPDLLRYWDGVAWTDEVAPLGSSASPPAPSSAVDDQPSAPSLAPVPPPPAPVTGPEGGLGGIRSELLDDRYAEVSSGHRVLRQNARMLKVTLGEPILARQGSMVAFQGAIDFDYEGGGAGRFAKKMLTGEGVSLMRCTGQGELFLAQDAQQVHILHLDGAALSVNGRNILAFEPSLDWNIERVKGAGMVAGGLFNTRLSGHGWVAIVTRGEPVVLRTDQPTFADPDAAVAWSAGLSTSLNRTVRAKALVGRGSGEAFQLAFSGQGLVIVQPAESAVAAVG